MASFKNLSRDEIPSATLITNLSPIRSDRTPVWGSEAWCCEFAPDESFFAWSSGNSIVILVPWKYCKSTLFCYPAFNAPAKTSFRISVEKQDEVVHYFGPKAISIHAGYAVRSVTFGLSKFSNVHKSNSTFWIRQSRSKDLFLGTGHNNGHIRIWDVLTGKLLLELVDHCDMISQLSFCPNGSLCLVSSSYDGTLKLWDLYDDGNMFLTLKMNGKPVYTCCWSPNAKMLISVGMSKLVYIWDMTSYTLKQQLKGHQHDVVACAFSPDSCLIATASWDTRVTLWDSFSGNMLKHFGHLYPLPRYIYACGENGTWIRGVSFSSDGAHIATVADDGYLRFWDITCGDNPKSVAAIDGSLCCCFAPSGGILAVGCRDGSVSFWRSPASVKSLLFLSRIAVRCCVPEAAIDELLIPQRLIDYLKYKELE